MAAGLAYGNHNAWYGQPNAFLGANPLANNPAGRGWSPWLEGAVELGIQGIDPLQHVVDHGQHGDRGQLAGGIGQVRKQRGVHRDIAHGHHAEGVAIGRCLGDQVHTGALEVGLQAQGQAAGEPNPDFLALGGADAQQDAVLDRVVQQR
jgi:hypothetical protein